MKLEKKRKQEDRVRASIKLGKREREVELPDVTLAEILVELKVTVTGAQSST